MLRMPMRMWNLVLIIVLLAGASARPQGVLLSELYSEDRFADDGPDGALMERSKSPQATFDPFDWCVEALRTFARTLLSRRAGNSWSKRCVHLILKRRAPCGVRSASV